MEKKYAPRIYHFFHAASMVRPIIWIASYVALVPVFALIYWWLPDGQFRIPDGAGTDFGAWLYYSIVTITTLGFGDYTPAHGWAQAVTAIEVMCGLIILGFFLNAVGSLKSEIDVESEVEKQKQAHFVMEKEKLTKSLPLLLGALDRFLSYCYAVTTPLTKRQGKEDGSEYNSEFTREDMADMNRPSGLKFDRTHIPAVSRLMKSAAQTSLCLDSLESRIDLTLWPDLLEDCFKFVAAWQMFTSADVLADHPDELKNYDTSKEELYLFIKENVPVARRLAAALTAASTSTYQG